MNRTKRRLKAVEQEMQRHAEEADAIWKKVDEEERQITDEERGEVDSHLKAIETLKGEKSDLEDAVRVQEDISRVSKAIPVEGEKKAEEKPEQRAKSLGEQFIESDSYKRLKSTDGFSGAWTTGKIDLEGKATLLLGELGDPGTGGALVDRDTRPGVQPILFERQTIASLLASGTTNSNVVRYIVETVADNGAETVAEGAEKPESALEFDEVSEPVRKIATFLPVSDEMLEDAAQIQSYINARLTLFVSQEEENQLLNGGGTGTDIDGLLNRVPAGNQDVTAGAGVQNPNPADHIYAGVTRVRLAFLEPDGIVVNPEDWAEGIRLLKDTTDNYLGGSPFSNDRGEPGESLWNKRVVVTQAIPSGTALVGAFGAAAQVFRRGGLSVEASNSHADFFRRNLTAIRAEERLALAVYRPEAFVTVDLSGGVGG